MSIGNFFDQNYKPPAGPKPRREPEDLSDGKKEGALHPGFSIIRLMPTFSLAKGDYVGNVKRYDTGKAVVGEKRAVRWDSTDSPGRYHIDPFA